MSFSLNKHQEEYIARLTKKGPYSNASEVVRDALRLHEEYHLRLEALRLDVKKGVESMKSGRVNRAGLNDIKDAAKKRRSKKKR
ncbi:MAG: type II toxin-antitoxin system ParD family antitoxin [Myxococcota bacterium]